MPHLSTAVRTGSLLFISGQLATDANGNISGGMEAQTALIMKKHFSLLADYGLSSESVVKVGVWITTREDFSRFDGAYAQAFGDHRPARSTVVSALAIKDAVVEIDLIASFEPVLL
ncbi:MAG: RidA family protein [Ewingella sp.]